MSNVRAEVLRVSRSRTGWRDGGGSGSVGGGNNSTGSSSTTTSTTSSANAGQIQYITSLKSTFEGTTNGDSNSTTPQETRSPIDAANFRPQRHGIGTKVSTIANMFQSMAPIVHVPLGRQQPAFKVESPQNGETMRITTATVVAQSPEVHKTFHHHHHHHQQQQQERRPSLIVEATSTSQTAATTPSGISVHLNRTESQVARFNSARAMFERLEEKIIQTSKAGSVSPRRSAFSPTLYSRSPSPVCSQTQSVGCSPKRGSPLSPREKSRSEDNIIMSDQPSAIINRDSIVVSSVDGSGSGSSRNSTSSSSYCSSSHVNNGRGGHNIDFDLTCSGAGEAIVSPGPLSPHLARYLAEDLLAMTAAPKCVGAEEKTSAVISSSSSKSPTKPSPLCPKPTDLMFVGKTPVVVANKRAPAGGTKRDDGSTGGLFSRRAAVVHGAGTASAVTTPPDQVVGAYIPVEEVNSDERPILIGVVEKKTMISQVSPLLHSDISAAMCNGRVSSTSSSDRHPRETVQRSSAVQPSAVEAQKSVSSPTVQERAIVVVEATNQQLLREVQGAFNRGTSSAASESGSQILVLSSNGKSFEHEDPIVLVASSPTAAVNQPADSTARALFIEGSPTAISRTLLSNHSTTMTTTTPVVSHNRSQSSNENGVTLSPKTNSTASLAPAETGTSSSLLLSPQLDSNDGYGFSSQGTSPLSPKVESGQIPLKADVSQNSVNGSSAAKPKPSVQHNFPTGADATRDFPELMTPEEANRLLSSSSDDHGDDVEPVVAKTQTRNSWYDDDDVMEDQEETPSSENDVQRGEDVTLLRDDDDDVDERLAVTTDDCMERLMHEEGGVHIYEDGHFWLEIPGLLESDNEEVLQAYGAIVTPKRRDRVKFSTKPIRVYSTFSVSDYDRRNDDVDPVSASAEYELEKRVEKMDVFPVELMKGPEGLGLSIIGMGVGADAGLEKLGIFVKTITDGGAAFKDGRIDVNDQIIEVDGKSLVGVTQAYAASVLRNTSGLVRFSIGRERDGENSEVAQLISQSLQADREREYRRKNYEQETTNQQRSSSDGGARNENAYPGLTLPIPSLSVQPSSSALDPRAMGQHQQEDSTPEEGEDEPTCEVFDLEGSSESPSPDSTDARIKINEVTILERLQSEHEEYEKRIRMLTARLAEVERIMDGAKDEVAKYQNMLEESQGQYIVLEKKYCKAKKLIKESQQREQDLLHREDYHIQQLEEKDQEYNALVKSLKDRVIQLEHELMETQRAAGLPVKLPYDNTSIKQLQLTPQLLRRQPPSAIQRKRTSSLLDTDISDSELADSSSNQFDISPDSDDMETKTSTVERKPLQAKDGADLFEKAVPQHELLDSTAAKTKAELASKLGSLANRQPPSLKKTSSSGSSGDGMPFDSRDSDSNDTSLGSSREDLECADPVIALVSAATLGSSAAPVAATTSLPSPLGDDEDQRTRGGADQQKVVEHRVIKTTKTTTTIEQGGRSGSPVRIDGKFAEEIRIILERKSIEAKRQAAASSSDLTTAAADQLPSPLASCQEKSAAHSTGHAHLLLTDTPRNMTPSPMSTVSSRSSSSNTTGGSDHGAVVVTGTAAANRLSSASAAVLHSLKRDSPNSGNVRLCPQSVPPFTCCCCLPGTALHIAEFSMSESVDYPDERDRDVRGSAPSIIGVRQSDHGGGGVTQAGSTNASGDRRPHQWHSCSVSDWSSGQVGQWLLALSMEQYISVFMDNNVGGQELLNMDSAKLKNMGVVNSNDRSLLKRRVKDLKALVEKERKAHEKEMRTKEKIQKKAERAAEKAVKRK